MARFLTSRNFSHQCIVLSFHTQDGSIGYTEFLVAWMFRGCLLIQHRVELKMPLNP